MPPRTPRPRPLNDALFSAIDKHAKFLEGKTTPLTISATMGGEAITPGEAVFTSEFGTVVTVKNTNTRGPDPRHLYLRPVRRRVPPCPWARWR